MNYEFDITYYYVDISGDHFSPQVAEASLGLQLFDKLEVGTPKTYLSPKHPFYGKPADQGWGTLQAPAEVPYNDQMEWLLEALVKHHKKLRSLGAEKLAFWEVRYLLRDQQENFELMPTNIAALHRSKTTYCLSVYHLKKKDFKNMGPRLYSKPWLLQPVD